MEPVRISSFERGGRTYRLREALPFNVEFSDGVWSYSNESLGIRGYAFRRDEALRELHEAFDFVYRDIAQESDDSLDERAIELKRQLLALVFPIQPGTLDSQPLLEYNYAMPRFNLPNAVNETETYICREVEVQVENCDYRVEYQLIIGLESPESVTPKITEVAIDCIPDLDEYADTPGLSEEEEERRWNKRDRVYTVVQSILNHYYKVEGTP